MHGDRPAARLVHRADRDLEVDGGRLRECERGLQGEVLDGRGRGEVARVQGEVDQGRARQQDRPGDRVRGEPRVCTERDTAAQHETVALGQPDCRVEQRVRGPGSARGIRPGSEPEALRPERVGGQVVGVRRGALRPPCGGGVSARVQSRERRTERAALITGPAQDRDEHGGFGE